MSSEEGQLSQVESIVAAYEADLRKAERDLDRAKKKVEQARSAVVVAKDMLERLKEGAGTRTQGVTKTLGDHVYEIISECPSAAGMTAKDIHAQLLKRGIHVDAAAVHVSAGRLEAANKIQMDTTSSVKLYRRLPEPEGGGE